MYPHIARLMINGKVICGKRYMVYFNEQETRFLLFFLSSFQLLHIVKYNNLNRWNALVESKTHLSK